MGFARFTGNWFSGDTGPPAEPIPIEGQLEGERILVPLLTTDVPALTDQIKVATTLARASNATLLFVNPITVPEQTLTIHSPHLSNNVDSALLNWALSQATCSNLHVDGGMLYARKLVSGVLQAVVTNDVDTLVLSRHSAGRSLTSETTQRIARQAECDVITVNGQPGFETSPSILLPVAGGPHSGVAADVTTCLAADADAWIDVLHVIESDATERQRERAERYVEAASQRIDRPETTTTWILEADDPTDAVIEQSQYYSQTVIGAPTKNRLRRFLSRSTNKSIRSNAQSIVLSVRNKTNSGSLA